MFKTAILASASMAVLTFVGVYFHNIKILISMTPRSPISNIQVYSSVLNSIID